MAIEFDNFNGNETRDITTRFLKSKNAGPGHAAFDAFWDKGVKVVAHFDNSANFNDLEGDLFSPECNPEYTPAQLKGERARFRARVRDQGVWGVGLEINGEPDYSTFVWGFVSDDFFGSGYDDELLVKMAEMGAQL